jgi:hypothetical protein
MQCLAKAWQFGPLKSPEMIKLKNVAHGDGGPAVGRLDHSP